MIVSREQIVGRAWARYYPFWERACFKAIYEFFRRWPLDSLLKCGIASGIVFSVEHHPAPESSEIWSQKPAYGW